MEGFFKNSSTSFKVKIKLFVGLFSSPFQFWCLCLQVHQYRIAMTAKDCSLMVALVPRGEEEEEDEE